MKKVFIAIGMTIYFAITALAAETSLPSDQASLEEISKELANPVSSIRNLPIRYDYDANIGDNNGSRSTLRIQPIISVPLSAEWSVMSRTVIPVINQTGVEQSRSIYSNRISWTQSGLGDIQESIFISTTTKGGLIYGFGPIISIPTSDEQFSSDRVGLGPTAVVLIQEGKWTLGAIGNHVWSAFGGGHPGDKGYTSMTMVQPFVVYNMPRGLSLGFNAESTYDWKNEVMFIPLTVQVGQVLRVGGQTISLNLGGKYVIPTDEDVNPEWGIRGIFTYVLPK